MNDVAAERAVLAGLFHYGADAYDEVADVLTARSFTVEANQVFWKCAEKLLKDGASPQLDYPSLLSASRSVGAEGYFEREEEGRYLRAIANFPVRKESVGRLGLKVRKLEIARLYETQLDVAKNNIHGITGDESIVEIMARAEGPVFDLSSLLTSEDDGFRLMGEGASDYIQHLMDNPRDSVGISTGINRFDQSIGGGLRPNSFDVIAARMKTGKSFLVDNVALHTAGKLGIPTYNADTEMTWEEHLHRVVANLAGVPTQDIETGKCGALPSRQSVLDAAARLKDMPYYYDCIMGRDFVDVMAGLRRWVRRTVGLGADGKAKPCVVLYDYLKLMDGSSLGNDLKEYQALGFMTTTLKNFMGRFGVACLAFAQTNRDGIDGEDTDVVGGSDRIGMYCTSLSLYKQKTAEERAESGPDGARYTHKLKTIASRHGRGLAPGDYINIQADYTRGRILEGPTRDELAAGKKGAVADEEQPPIALAG